LKRKTIEGPIWDFTSPSYDARDLQGAGDDYGVGIRARVGKQKESHHEGVPQDSFVIKKVRNTHRKVDWE
jgi:hypothetical protein